MGVLWLYGCIIETFHRCIEPIRKRAALGNPGKGERPEFEIAPRTRLLSDFFHNSGFQWVDAYINLYFRGLRVGRNGDRSSRELAAASRSFAGHRRFR